MREFSAIIRGERDSGFGSSSSSVSGKRVRVGRGEGVRRGVNPFNIRTKGGTRYYDEDGIEHYEPSERSFLNERGNYIFESRFS